MIDVPGEIGSMHREAGEGRVPAGEARTVLVRRTYPAPVEDVWDVITDLTRPDPDRSLVPASDRRLPVGTVGCSAWACTSLVARCAEADTAVENTTRFYTGAETP